MARQAQIDGGTTRGNTFTAAKQKNERNEQLSVRKLQHIKISFVLKLQHMFYTKMKLEEKKARNRRLAKIDVSNSSTLMLYEHSCVERVW